MAISIDSIETLQTYLSGVMGRADHPLKTLGPSAMNSQKVKLANKGGVVTPKVKNISKVLDTN